MEKKKKRKRGDNYSFYAYFRKKPAVLITIITAAISFLSIIFNAITSSLKARYYDYWGFDTTVVKNIPNGDISSFWGIFVCVAFIVLAESLIVTIFDVYFRNKGHFAVIYKKAKIIKRQKRKQKRLSETGNPIIEKCSMLEFGNKEKLDNVYSRNKMIRNEFTTSLLLLIPLLIACFCVLYLFLPIYIDTSLFYIVTVAFIVILIIITFLVNLLFHLLGRKSREKAIKEMSNEEFGKKAEELLLRFPLIKLRNYRARDFLSNSNILNCCLVLVVFLVITLVCISLCINDLLSNDKSFSVLNYNESSYVVIFSDENYFYCDGAIINNNNISIYKNEHLIIPKANLPFYNQEFKRRSLLRKDTVYYDY